MLRQSGLRNPGPPSAPCPCCVSSLTRVKQAMAAVSRSLGEPLPEIMKEAVAPELAGLSKALQRLDAVPETEPFHAAVAALDRRLATVPGGASTFSALRYALEELAAALSTLTAELQDSRTHERHTRVL